MKVGRTARYIRPPLNLIDETMTNTVEDSQESNPTNTPPSQDELPAEPLVVVSGGRRRGRRKVMKKKMLKDEEGYLGSSL